MNDQVDGIEEGGCGNPGFQFYTITGHINYQSLEGGKLNFGWQKEEWLVNHPSGNVYVEFQPDTPDRFTSAKVSFRNNSDNQLSKRIWLDVSTEQTAAWINKWLTFRGRVEGAEGFKAAGESRSFRLINDQLPPLDCDSFVHGEEVLDLSATTNDYLSFAQEPPSDGRSGYVAPVVVCGGIEVSMRPVYFSAERSKNLRSLTIEMPKVYLRYFVGQPVYVGCLWSFEKAQYYSEMRKLTVTGAATLAV